MRKIRVLALLTLVFTTGPFLTGCGSKDESKPNPELGPANKEGPPKRNGTAADQGGKGGVKKP